MAKLKNKIVSKQSWKYYFSEILASFAALVTSTVSAVIADRLTDYDIIISVVSAVGGTAGFVIGALVIFAILHIPEYKAKKRNFVYDMKSIAKANIHGIIAMYAFRIPFQYILQKKGITPAYAACISQFLSGLIATAVRIYHNYKAKVFAN
jgi:hypothetical protein